MKRFWRAQSRIGRRFELASQYVTHWTGTSWAFTIACLVVGGWLLSGPAFDYSDTWQMVINTCTTIITFLMVFLIQRTQNKDGLAIQLKLNELVAAIAEANNRLIDVEDLSEEDLLTLRKHYEKLAEMAQKEEQVAASHSLEIAEQRHHHKRAKRRKAQTDSNPTER